MNNSQPPQSPSYGPYGPTAAGRAPTLPWQEYTDRAEPGTRGGYGDPAAYAYAAGAMHQTYGPPGPPGPSPYGTRPAHGTHPAYGTPAYGTPSAYGAHPAYADGPPRAAAPDPVALADTVVVDTYRPAYEAAAAAAAGAGAGGGAGWDDVAARAVAETSAGPTVVLAPGGGRRAAPRRASGRRRRSAERPVPLRRLVPQALVVAFLAGGTSAFVAKDKAIELSVDGRPRTLHTFADDVTELLAEEGVEVGAHDVVAPAPGAPLASGDEVAVRYGRPLRLTLDGERRTVWTTAHTVEGALAQLGVRAEGAYVSTSRGRRIGREGLALDVRTERAVTVVADGQARTIRTNAATVREAVEEAGVTLRGMDTTSVPQDGFPRDGQAVTVLRITGTREVREETIPYDVDRTDDPTLFRGTEVVERPGRPGVRRVTYSLRTVNGVREKPRRIRSEVIRAPQTRVVKVGTKAMPTSVRGADHLNWGALAACESGGRPDAVDASGTYGGLYQFDARTWRSLGGSGRPQDAPAAEQTMRAKKLYIRRGAGPWPHCGARLHS